MHSGRLDGSTTLRKPNQLAPSEMGVSVHSPASYPEPHSKVRMGILYRVGKLDCGDLGHYQADYCR